MIFENSRSNSVLKFIVGAVDYPVTINVKESFFFAKRVVLKWYDEAPSNSNWLRSFNPGKWWIPMWMKYRGKYGCN